MPRLQTLIKDASFLVFVTGFVFSAISYVAIKESRAIGVGRDYVTSLDAFDLVTPAEITPPISVQQGGLIGTLSIPRLNKTIPILEGTAPEQLEIGAGHYMKSVMPGQPDNSVIAGHRDSVFAQFGSLQKNDELIVSTAYGKFTYKIDGFRVVDADDRTVIVPTETAILTLSTCYPFRFIGNAPRRFIVTASLVVNPITSNKNSKTKSEAQK
jgi:sortase A